MSITATDFDRVVAAIRAGEHAGDIGWSENICAPIAAEEFASEAIFVICNSGMKNTVARQIYDRVMHFVVAGESAHEGFAHIGKCNAIDTIWARRVEFYDAFLAASDKIAFCVTLPWIGDITKYHLAKNFGAQVAKPDVHLQRLADHEGCTAQALCERLALTSGLKVATVDVVLWRACAVGIINSRTGEVHA